MLSKFSCIYGVNGLIVVDSILDSSSKLREKTKTILRVHCLHYKFFRNTEANTSVYITCLLALTFIVKLK